MCVQMTSFDRDFQTTSFDRDVQMTSCDRDVQMTSFVRDVKMTSFVRDVPRRPCDGTHPSLILAMLAPLLYYMRCSGAGRAGRAYVTWPCIFIEDGRSYLMQCARGTHKLHNHTSSGAQPLMAVLLATVVGCCKFGEKPDSHGQG